MYQTAVRPEYGSTGHKIIVVLDAPIQTHSLAKTADYFYCDSKQPPCLISI